MSSACKDIALATVVVTVNCVACGSAKNYCLASCKQWGQLLVGHLVALRPGNCYGATLDIVTLSVPIYLPSHSSETTDIASQRHYPLYLTVDQLAAKLYSVHLYNTTLPTRRQDISKAEPPPNPPTAQCQLCHFPRNQTGTTTFMSLQPPASLSSSVWAT